MATLALTASGDLDIGTSKTLSVVTDPDQAAAYILFHKFRRFLGEWFLNTLEGIDYYGAVFVKNPDLGHIRQLFRSVILGTPPIVNTAIQLSVNNATRELDFAFQATTQSGAIITGGSGQPFVVEKR